MFRVKNDAAIDASSTPNIRESENEDEICKIGANNILNPIKVKIIANPYFNFEKISSELDNKKNIERKPKIANTFDE